jgi:hypothetical protein
MQTTNIWHKFHLHRTKISFVLCFLAIFLSGELLSQVQGDINLPNSDVKKMKYGFSVGIHGSTFKLKYADIFTAPEFDSVRSIDPINSFGFSIAVIVNFKLAEYLDFKVTPRVGFYQNTIEFTYTDPNTEVFRANTELTRLAVPVLFKYKSQRRGNTRMYVTGGFTPSLRVSGSKKEADLVDRIIVQNENLTVDFGFGIDLYYPLFRFSPEIRFSKGINNLLVPAGNDIAAGIERLSLNTVTLFFQVGD